MIVAGKVIRLIQIGIREWLLDYEPSHEQFEGPIIAYPFTMAMILLHGLEQTKKRLSRSAPIYLTTSAPSS